MCFREKFCLQHSFHCYRSTSAVVRCVIPLFLFHNTATYIQFCDQSLSQTKSIKKDSLTTERESMIFQIKLVLILFALLTPIQIAILTFIRFPLIAFPLAISVLPAPSSANQTSLPNKVPYASSEPYFRSFFF